MLSANVLTALLWPLVAVAAAAQAPLGVDVTTTFSRRLASRRTRAPCLYVQSIWVSEISQSSPTSSGGGGDSIQVGSWLVSHKLRHAVFRRWETTPMEMHSTYPFKINWIASLLVHAATVTPPPEPGRLALRRRVYSIIEIYWTRLLRPCSTEASFSRRSVE